MSRGSDAQQTPVAAGIDLGGTKIEAQVYDSAWRLIDRHRIETPRDYDALVTAVAAQIDWATDKAGAVPVGISAAGLINPATGLALTANLPATGKPFRKDIEAASGRSVAFLNDCRAFTLSEARFGAGRGAEVVAGLILGTGVGGGLSVGGRLVQGPSSVGGEFGHYAAPAHLVLRHGLPVMGCGCGRTGCIETLVSGPGLTRVAERITGRHLSPPQIAADRHGDPKVQAAWQVWCDLVAELLQTLITVADPDIVVLGGGLSQIDGVERDIAASLALAGLKDFALPSVVLAEGGDASGARGAAYAAWQEAGHG